jgi:DNA end-binding protein Ku
MESTGRAGIATFVMRTKEYLVAIIAEGGILRAETLRFHDEVRPVEEIDLPGPPEIAAKRVKDVKKAVGKLTRKTLDESELEDDYARRLRALVEEKRKKGQDVVSVEGETAPAGDEDDEGHVIDLMEVLKRSLQRPEPGARRAGGREGKSAGKRGQPARGEGGDLRGLTKDQLYERAREQDIAGRSAMTKEELIRALRRTA